ncbi:MAG: glycosyltransferase [Bacteroidales bacterium]|nr:glycosyltransferase [Bacteroidales bacterium]
MRVLHISTHLTGGAALAALRLDQALLENGVDTRVLTLDDKIGKKHTVQYKPLLDFCRPKRLAKVIKSLLYKLNLGMGRYWHIHDEARKHGECQYTYPISLYRVERHPLVKWADIIHLHFCDDFINYPTFFKNVKKPIVWTLHDIGIGYGGFHYKNDYERLLPYFRQIEYNFIKIKKTTLLKNQHIHLVSLSQEMYDFTKDVDYLKEKPNTIIPNSVDTKRFLSLDKYKSRDDLGLPKEKTIFLFVSEYVETLSKGLDLLKQVIASINNTNILLGIVGNYNKELPMKDTIDTRYFGKISDSETMSKLYSASDLLVVPSFQESFGQTPLESMACGTPVVVFPTGAMKDYVHKEQGIVCSDCTVEALQQGIIDALANKYDHSALRQYVKQNFSPEFVAKQYSNLYHSLL